jgi:HlyD family secretion protein
VSHSADAALTVRRFQSETDAIREMPEPRWARATVFALAGMLLLVLALMFLTSIDRVISSDGGRIVSVEPPSVYQALDPSIIKSIDVREGDQVAKGQLLATLDPTFTEADVRALEQQVASLDTQIARITAQLSGKAPDFGESDDADYRKYAALQQATYDQQMAQYKAQVDSFDAKIAATQATIAKYASDESGYQDRAAIAEKVEQMRTTLAASGSGSQLNKLLSQDNRVELERSLAYARNSLAEASQTEASLKADRDAFIQQWRAQLSEELVTARNNLDAAKASLDKASKKQDLVSLTASEPSVVLTLARLSVGSVLKSGDSLMTLMPLNAPVEAEINIAARDIGFVRPGDPCTLKVGAYNFMEHGTAEGKVRWISDNAFTTDENGQPVSAYYKARCSVDASHFQNVPANFRLIPGMTLQADLKIGTRSVAMYVLGGTLRVFGEAMREP